MNKRYTLSQLEAMPTIEQGHFDNLKFKSDDGKIRVWLSRMTIEDGMAYNNQVTVEEYKNIDNDWKWETIDEYEAK